MKRLDWLFALLLVPGCMAHPNQTPSKASVPRVIDRVTYEPGRTFEVPGTWPEIPRDVVTGGHHPQSAVFFLGAWYDEDNRIFLEFADQNGRCRTLTTPIAWVTFNSNPDLARRIQAGGWSVWLTCSDKYGRTTFEGLAAK